MSIPFLKFIILDVLLSIRLNGFAIVLEAFALEVIGLVAAAAVADDDVVGVAYSLSDDSTIKMPDDLWGIYSHNALSYRICSM